jgi:hypothetical protein
MPGAALHAVALRLVALAVLKARRRGRLDPCRPSTRLLLLGYIRGYGRNVRNSSWRLCVASFRGRGLRRRRQPGKFAGEPWHQRETDEPRVIAQPRVDRDHSLERRHGRAALAGGTLARAIGSRFELLLDLFALHHKSSAGTRLRPSTRLFNGGHDTSWMLALSGFCARSPPDRRQ